VREFNVYRWAGRMLTDAGQWRLRERITRRVQRRSRESGEEALTP
jgi:trehalose 6-phosphate synthase